MYRDNIFFFSSGISIENLLKMPVGCEISRVELGEIILFEFE